LLSLLEDIDKIAGLLLVWREFVSTVIIDNQVVVNLLSVVKSVMAVPVAPARPVRPIRWM
jgi:hypothetical protein